MFGQRLGLLLAGLFTAAAVVVCRLWWVQFVAVDDIRDRALQARRVEIPLPAARGAIRDASGRVVARDRAAFSVFLIPSTYRERSLLNAIVDLEVMIGRGGGAGRGRRGPEGEAWRVAHLREDARESPWTVVERVLELPAAKADPRALAGASLCYRDRADRVAAGGLIRTPEGLAYRLRQCLGVVQGRGLPFLRPDLSRLRTHGGTLGEALGVGVDEVATRLMAEVRVIDEVGEALRFSPTRDIWDRIDGLIAREIAWVRSKEDAELRSLMCLEAFGAPVLRPGGVPLSEYTKVVRDLALPYPEEAASAAKRAVVGAQALLAGVLPPLDAGAARGSADQASEDDPSVALEAADAEGLVDPMASRVEAAWFARARAQLSDEREFMSPRRRAELRSRYRGGRSFLLGRGAPARVAARVVGPGRLESVGFRLVPAFVRDAAVTEALPPMVRQIIGTVTGSSRKGAFGVEASMNDLLAGADGRASVNRSGGVVLERQPERAGDVELSFSVDVIDALQRAAPADIPFGLAVVDVKTGAVVGMSSGPVAGDHETAVEAVLERELERGALRRARALTEDARAHELGRLASRETLSKSDRVFRTVLEGFEQGGEGYYRARSRQLAQLEARSPGHNRSYDIPTHSPPGSVFKALTVLLGFRAGVINDDSTFDCVGMRRRRPHGCKDHGAGLDSVTALAKSCNLYCYEVADRLRTRDFVDFYEELGLFRKVPGLPVARQSRQTLLRDGARNLSIGMGSVHCVPVQAAGLAATLARGRVVRPWVAGGPLEPGPRIVSPGNEWMLRRVHKGMVEVCSGRGTARRHSEDLRRLRVAAKTGTADHPGPSGYKVNEAWFVGFAPAEDPKLAFAVVLPDAPASANGVDGIQGADAAPYAVRALEICAEAMGIRWW